VLEAIVNIRKEIKKDFNVRTNSSPVFLVRVDDFPRWDLLTKDFLRFHEVLLKHDIPYLLGVIPFRSQNPLMPSNKSFRKLRPADLDILSNLKLSGVNIAMHGVTHQTVRSFRKSEIIGVSKSILEKRITAGLKELNSHGIQTDIFIPPFNSFDLASAEILCKYFKIICGGPESVPLIGLKTAPSFIGDTLYMPSYYPAYGRSKQIIPFVERVKQLDEFVVVPITLHWAWESNNAFSALGDFCKSISGRVISWTDYRSLILGPANSPKDPLLPDSARIN
jgi:hypothetical protein